MLGWSTFDCVCSGVAHEPHNGRQLGCAGRGGQTARRLGGYHPPPPAPGPTGCPQGADTPRSRVASEPERCRTAALQPTDRHRTAADRPRSSRWLANCSTGSRSCRSRSATCVRGLRRRKALSIAWRRVGWRRGWRRGRPACGRQRVERRRSREGTSRPARRRTGRVNLAGLRPRQHVYVAAVAHPLTARRWTRGSADRSNGARRPPAWRGRLHLRREAATWIASRCCSRRCASARR